MSTIRITQRLMTERSMTAMQTGMNRLARSQEQLSTGRQINRPSDSPAGTNSAMRLREQMAADAQHSRNAADGLSWLGRTDNTLTTMVDATRRARDILVQGANGSMGPQSKQALAAEMRQIRDNVFALANTQHLGRPLFGGTTDQPGAYVEGTGADAGKYFFVSDDPANPTPVPGDVTRRVGTDVSVKISTLGPEAFGAGDDNLFNILTQAADAIENGTASDFLDDVDGAMDKMMTALADVGTRYGRVEKAQAAAQNAELDMQAMLSEVENVDIAKAIVDLQMQEVAYQAALGATARVIQPSLLDFLR
ncbi:MAG: flagellar hook-associated protein FlgL [Actinomycetota bacterium]